ELFDGLVRRAIFAESDRIVGVNVDDVSIHDARQPYRWPHVIREDQERRAVWNDATGKRHTVHDRAHPVLADAEMKVPTAVALGGEARLALDDGVGRAGEIRRTTDQLRNLLGDGIEHDTGRGAAGDISILDGEDR